LTPNFELTQELPAKAVLQVSLFEGAGGINKYPGIL
jgi:hypothetical protein